MRHLLLLTCTVAGLALPATALAQDATEGYGSVAGVAQTADPGGNVATARAADPQVAEAGSLPFTGLELGVVAAGGAALLGTGLALRRVRVQ